MIVCTRNHRDLDPSELPARFERDWNTREGKSLLTTARRPAKKWTDSLGFAHPLILSSAPQFELILWVPKEADLSLPAEVSQEQEYLLGEYRELFELPGPVADCARFKRYVTTLQEHIQSQEEALFPSLAELAPIERALRELGYEHRGLEKGCAPLAVMADQARAGELSPQARERFDLDFFHLLEHHIERERDALFPAMVFLNGVDRQE